MMRGSAAVSGMFRALRDEKDNDVERVEVELLLEAIYRVYGFDFRSYAYASIKRRLWRRAQAEGLSTFSALQERVLLLQAVR